MQGLLNEIIFPATCPFLERIQTSKTTVSEQWQGDMGRVVKVALGQ